MALRPGELIALEMAFLKNYENGLVAMLLFQISRLYQVGLGIKHFKPVGQSTWDSVVGSGGFVNPRFWHLRDKPTSR